MRSEKKRIIVCAVAAAVLTAAVVLLFVFLSRSDVHGRINNEVSGSGYTVILDPAHGGTDTGAVGEDVPVFEARINYSIAKRLKKYFKSVGMEVIMTRTGAESVSPTPEEDMRRRIKLIEESQEDLTVSIHMNWDGEGRASGPAVRYEKGDERSEKLAQSIASAMTVSMGIEVGTEASEYGEYELLADTAPAAAVYCGYLSDPAEEALLKKDKYQIMISEGISKGVMDYLAASGK